MNRYIVGSRRALATAARLMTRNTEATKRTPFLLVLSLVLGVSAVAGFRLTEAVAMKRLREHVAPGARASKCRCPVVGPPKPLDMVAPFGHDRPRVGDRAWARWPDLYWYPGTIQAIGKRGFHVRFDDGDQRINTKEELLPLKIWPGQMLFVQPNSVPHRLYFRAFVTRVDGETLDVRFDGGHVDRNTNVGRARMWTCPVQLVSVPFRAGDRVLALDIDGLIYPADILFISGNRILVHFLDGPGRFLTPERIHPYNLRKGRLLECRRGPGSAYQPGRLVRIDDERVLVSFDDGSEEWSSVGLCRFFRKPKVAM